MQANNQPEIRAPPQRNPDEMTNAQSLGQARWQRYTFDRASRAVSAQVDPDRVLLLDVNYTNNSKTLEPQSARAAATWSLAWLIWLQDALLAWAALA